MFSLDCSPVADVLRETGMKLRFDGRMFAAILLALFMTMPVRAQEFFFRDGDVIVMIGDSITEQHLYSNYVEMWTVSRFPSWKLTFRNVGIGGDRSTGGNQRFKRDVISFKPTAMTVDFGMNDGNYQPFAKESFQIYMNGLQGIADQAQAAKIRVAWITPSPMENQENGPALSGYNKTLEQFSAGVREIAEKNRGLFIDQFHPFIDTQNIARAANPGNRIFGEGADPIHPGPPGQALMAWAILKGMHFPTLVSSVEIEAGGNQPSGKTQNCRVTHLEKKNDCLVFEQEDAALPFFPDQAKSILRWAPILDELNEYRLKVSGLKPGRYEIRLGNKKVAEHSDTELTAGVNLAAAVLKTGPIAEQVKRVWDAVQAKNTYYHDHIFRGVVLVQVKLPDFLDLNLTHEEIEAKRQAAVDARLKKMPELDAAIQKALTMHPHQVEIARIEK
jgi:lysophospholipase L1-like esterase